MIKQISQFIVAIVILAIAQPTQAQWSFQIQPPKLVHQASRAKRSLARVGSQRKIGLHAPYPGCRLQFHVDPLRAILKEPLPTVVARVIALDEVNEFFVLQQRAFGTRQSARKSA